MSLEKWRGDRLSSGLGDAVWVRPESADSLPAPAETRGTGYAFFIQLGRRRERAEGFAPLLDTGIGPDAGFGLISRRRA